MASVSAKELPLNKKLISNKLFCSLWLSVYPACCSFENVISLSDVPLQRPDAVLNRILTGEDTVDPDAQFV